MDISSMTTAMTTTVATMMKDLEVELPIMHDTRGGLTASTIPKDTANDDSISGGQGSAAKAVVGWSQLTQKLRELQGLRPSSPASEGIKQSSIIPPLTVEQDEAITALYPIIKRMSKDIAGKMSQPWAGRGDHHIGRGVVGTDESEPLTLRNQPSDADAPATDRTEKTPSDMVIVQNMDWEMDDQSRAKHLLRLITHATGSDLNLDLGEDRSIRPGRPDVVFVTGERNGQHKKTFWETVRLVGMQLGPADDGGDDEDDNWDGDQGAEDAKAKQQDGSWEGDLVKTWSKYGVTVMNGASLWETDNGKWKSAMEEVLSSGGTALPPLQEPTPRTALAAARLSDILAGRPYVFHGNTSCVLFAHLPKEVKSRCALKSMTNAFMYSEPSGSLHSDKARVEDPNEGRWAFQTVANVNFDLASYVHTASHCARLGIPFVPFHGSMLGFTKQTYNEMDNWSEVWDQKVSKDTAGMYTRQIANSIRLAARWLAQVESDLRGVGGVEFAGMMSERLGELEKKERIEKVERGSGSGEGRDKHSGWKEELVKSSSFEPSACKWTRERRLRALETVHDDPLSNSLADYIPAVYDGPMGETSSTDAGARSSSALSKLLMIPCTFDPRLLTQNGGKKLHNISVDLESPTTYIPVNGDEAAFTEMFDGDFEYFKDRSRDDKSAGRDGGEDAEDVEGAGGGLVEILTEPLARELDSWLSLERRSAKAILQFLDDKREELGGESEEDGKVRECMSGMLAACEGGSMASRVRAMLQGQSSGLLGS